ncbi:lytic transglycosylase domain-containing protein [Pseudarcicella hirudinis]|uniref:lytic transglycosylase domain-containing protein n=1 Tax=Pseudarcicella hirudinis TaxID=1079859 RepID=UPI0035EDDDFE
MLKLFQEQEREVYGNLCQTARIDFGLRIDEYVDERFDPERATEAACRYMKQLYNIFGDWQLVLASYNTGPGNVRRAIRRCSGGQTFWDIYNCLPRETRGYVPQYIGIIYMMNHGADHDIAPEMLETAIPNDTILVNGFLDIDKLASLSNINLENIQKLNPHILTHILPGSTRNFPLRLPREEMAYLVANRKTVFDSLSKVSPSVIEQLAPAPEVMVASNSNGPILTEEETKKGKVTVEEDIEDVVINKKPKKKYML